MKIVLWSITFVEKVDGIACLNQQNFDKLLNSAPLAKLITLWDKFTEHDNGELSAYWMTYADIIENVVLGLLRSSHEGKWSLHVHAIKAMIPWCFAYDRMNYARYLSEYFAELTNLPVKNPDVYEEFKAGQFSVQISSCNPFGRIPVD